LTLVKGIPRLDIRTEFDNQAADHRLEVQFPSGIQTDHARMDGHFDVNERKTALPETDATWAELPRPEVPQRAFCDVSTSDHGLMIANRGLPEVAVLTTVDGTSQVSMTLLRCVGWLSREDLWNRRGHAGPGLPTPGAQEIGIHTFEYAIIPHDGNWKAAARQANAFNSPLDAVPTNQHTGSLPAQGSLIACDSPDFVITAVKAAEKGDGWLVRGFNMSDDPIQVILQTGIPFTTASEVFLDESHKRTISPESDGSLKLAVGDHEIISIKFEHA
jgi:mannosylglycerate hydrolase